MSYGVYLVTTDCPTCGRRGDEPELPDPTYNLTPIFDLALTGEELPNPDVAEIGVVLMGKETDRPRGLRLLSGRTGADTIEQLARAVARLNDSAKAASFRELEPSNGWGTLGDARTVMRELLEAAVEYPDNVWAVQ